LFGFLPERLTLKQSPHQLTMKAVHFKRALRVCRVYCLDSLLKSGAQC